MYNYANQPLGISQVFAHSYQLWRNTLKRTFFVALFFAILGGVPSFIFPGLNTTHAGLFLDTLEGIGWPVFGHTLMVLFAYLLLFHHVINAIADKPYQLFRDIGRSFCLYPKTIVAFILMTIMLAIGYTLLLIPGIILSVCLALYIPLIVTENVPVWEGFKYSCALVWRHWLRTAIVLLFMTLLFLVVAAAVQFLAHDIGVLTHPKGGEIWALHNGVRIVLAAFYTPFIVAVLLVQLHDLKLREQAAD